MIAARVAESVQAFTLRLTARVKTLAEARAADRLLARRGGERRWRSAGALWPFFGSE